MPALSRGSGVCCGSDINDGGKFNVVGADGPLYWDVRLTTGDLETTCRGWFIL